MADISKIQTNGETYDVKDATARDTAETANTNAGNAFAQVQIAQSTAEGAQLTADSKVSSVNIGTVTTGDEPSVTNSGTDKDVVMDFVFPSGGSRIVSGTLEAGGNNDEVTFTGSMVTVFVNQKGIGTVIFTCAYGDCSYAGDKASGGVVDIDTDGTSYTLWTESPDIAYTAIVIP